MQKEVKKAIFPIAGLATRFLPLSKIVSKELLPLMDKPLLHYTVEEAIKSGVNEIQFITRPKQKQFAEYFERNRELEGVLEERGKIDDLNELKRLADLFSKLKTSSVMQKQALGSANACFQAKDFVKKEPCAVFFSDDIIYSEEPGLAQLNEVFKTCLRPVVALKTLPNEKLPNYGVVEVEKIANSFFKIKRLVQKPKNGTAPSNLAVLGRMILTPDVFEYLGENKSLTKKDFCIVQVLGKMAEEGKPVYGYEIKGEWLECGTKPLWYKSFLTLLLNDKRCGEEIRSFLKGKL